MKKPIKICENPDCRDEIVDYKSSKIKYCNDYCRNHHGYKRRSEENLEFTNYKKRLIENYKLLKLYQDKNILSEDLIKFEKLGFDPKYLPEIRLYIINGKQTKCYKIKDIVFGLNSEDETKIIIYKKTEKK
jgi:hypothetical protein